MLPVSGLTGTGIQPPGLVPKRSENLIPAPLDRPQPSSQVAWLDPRVLGAPGLLRRLFWLRILSWSVELFLIFALKCQPKMPSAHKAFIPPCSLLAGAQARTQTHTHTGHTTLMDGAATPQPQELRKERQSTVVHGAKFIPGCAFLRRQHGKVLTFQGCKHFTYTRFKYLGLHHNFSIFEYV